MGPGGETADSALAAHANGPLTARQASELILDEGSTETQRAAAASHLAGLRTDAGWDALSRAMAADAPTAAALAAIVAVTDAGTPASMVGPLVRACDDIRGNVSHAAAVALGGAPSSPREAIGAVVKTLSRATTPAERTALWGALVRLTGRDDLPAEPALWDGWWREHGFLPEGEWRVRLSNAQAARAQRLARERDALTTRLADAYGRVYALTRAEERSGMLAGMLKDESPQVRLIGFDLASRALLNAQPLDGSVADAAVPSLSAGAHELRAAAARLLANLAPKDIAPAIAALRAETDERVAAPLLRLLANRPDPAEISLCMKWLATSGPARPAAAEALAAIHRISPLDHTTGANAIDLLSKIDPARISASSARLLGTLAAPTHTEALRAIWHTGEPGARTAMAEGLASSDSGLALLLSIAGQPEIQVFDLACRALATRTPTVEMFERLRSVGAHLGEARLDGLARVLLAFPEETFRHAVYSVDNPTERREVLARAGALSAAGAGETAARIALAGAEDALQTRDGQAALQILDSAAAARNEPAFRRARVIALVLLARLDEAEAVGAAANAWLDALALCAGSPHETTVRERIARLFETSLTPAERERLYGSRTPQPSGGPDENAGEHPPDS
ncbi:MAG: hypothetical protein AB7G17_00010 [Phycisphaerales bacterium]